mmetsp:Transcript_29329/g.80563  ORF Transcript_29329/g.80563 Transcript_29329/m.80563 type:complete len:171 (+) Transcript_29329:1322-1834(+)
MSIDHNARLVRGEPVNAESGVRPLENPEGAAADADSVAGTDTSKTASSLLDLVGLRAPGLCSGIVQVCGTIPSLQETSEAEIRRVFEKQGAMGLVLREGDLELEVLVEWDGPCARSVSRLLREYVEGSQGNVSLLQSAIERRQSWRVEILSTILDGGMYFVIESLLSADG